MQPNSSLTKSIREEPAENSNKLFILFGGKNNGFGIPPFEFANSLKILNYHKIFLRDFRQNWYHSGLAGLTSDIPETVTLLTERIREINPHETTLIGNSMGGFAAILFAKLIGGNCRAVAFAPQTFINPIKRFRLKDKRWNREIIKTYYNSLLRKKYYDLSKFDPSGDDWSARIFVSSRHRLDRLHAINIAHLPQVAIQEFDYDSHRLVKKLRDEGKLAGIIDPDCD
jgi:pimeloyl-ACP methyl ester carboxylesterase